MQDHVLKVLYYVVKALSKGFDAICCCWLHLNRTKPGLAKLLEIWSQFSYLTFSINRTKKHFVSSHSFISISCIMVFRKVMLAYWLLYAFVIAVVSTLALHTEISVHFLFWFCCNFWLALVFHVTVVVVFAKRNLAFNLQWVSSMIH